MIRRSPGKPAPARRGPTPRGISTQLPASGSDGSGEEAALDVTDRFTYVRERIRAVPDFPKPGILFRDITPVLADPRAFHMVIDALVEQFIGIHIDAVVAVESRGFIFGAPLASRLNTSFVPARKPGKLPSETVRVEYALEYGRASLEMHKDALEAGDEVLVIDDLLATGGTAAAAGELAMEQGANVVAYAFVIELAALGGRSRLDPVPVHSLIQF
jgi:adenine phosphoribosyltransferase